MPEETTDQAPQTSQPAPESTPAAAANGHADDNTMRFSLTRKERKVELAHPDGSTRRYLLREMDGPERDRFLARSSKRVKRGAKNPYVTNFDGVYAELISFCLYDETGGRVPVAMIQLWNASTQTALFKEAQKMNGLNLDAEEDAGNA